MSGAVKFRFVTIDDDDKRIGVGLIVDSAIHSIQSRHNSSYAVAFELPIYEFRCCTEQPLGEHRQGGLIGRRFGKEGDLHGFTETPPNTPLYHMSPRRAVPRISSKCSTCDNCLNCTSSPSFWANTISSGWSRYRSSR